MSARNLLDTPQNPSAASDVLTDRQGLMAILHASASLLDAARFHTLSIDQVAESARLIQQLAFEVLGHPDLATDPDWPGNHQAQEVRS